MNTKNFGRMAAMASFLFALGATAQTTPARDGGTMDSPPPRMERATEAQEHDGGWQRFDESRSAEMGLDDAQTERLRVLDEQYDREFQALGDDAVNNPRYNELRQRRDEEVRNILTEEQYEQYSRGETQATPATPDR